MSVERRSAGRPVRSWTQVLWSGAMSKSRPSRVVLNRATELLQTPQAPSYKIQPFGGSCVTRLVGIPMKIEQLVLLEGGDGPLVHVG
jgi:hypothetical protein